MMLEKIIRIIKKDPTYQWESIYSFRELFSIGFDRGTQALRGLPLKLFLKKSHGLVFRGKGVILKHAYNISAGRNLILEDNVSMNALSYDGIQLGNDVTIGKNSIFVCTGVVAQKGVGIKIGNGTGINARAFLGGQGGIVIGENVIIGPDVKIFSENHNFREEFPAIKKQGVSRKGVKNK
jgi:acetyltransferase-like isoleucine patch superfamily enzyme